MRRFVGGFTIVEAAISVAIGGLLLISAAVLLNGQKGSTEFNQAMRDVESKIRTLISEVNSGTLTISNKYNCRIDSNNRPALNFISSGPAHEEGTSSDCLVMGKAIQTIQSKSQLHIYTVLGLRADTYEQSNPTPAIAVTGGNLTDVYDIANEGAEVTAAGYNSGANRADMIGLYYDPRTTTVVNRLGSQPLLAKAYELRSDTDDPVNNVREYIEERNGRDNVTLDANNKYKICFQSNDGNHTASLEIISGAQGVNTDLKFEGGGC